MRNARWTKVTDYGEGSAAVPGFPPARELHGNPAQSLDLADLTVHGRMPPATAVRDANDCFGLDDRGSDRTNTIAFPEGRAIEQEMKGGDSADTGQPRAQPELGGARIPTPQFRAP
ncbi:MAG: hypothetical protein GY708_30470 [Actinomycetia bacterium]|nr:hypothetical protein [Actinomycetes bacterium]MCP4962312.1 hypothetical protein [Actinomycetes bacterium]